MASRRDKKNQDKKQVKNPMKKPNPAHDIITHPDSGAQMSFQEDIAKLREEFVEIVTNIQTRYYKQLTDMKTEISEKHGHIVDLNRELMEVKKELFDVKTGMEFTNKTIEENEKLNTSLKCELKQANEEVQIVKEKTEDLADRGRRKNLVFFNVPETDNRDNKEDCEQLIFDELSRAGLLTQKGFFFDRAHRLGPKKHNQRHQFLYTLLQL